MFGENNPELDFWGEKDSKVLYVALAFVLGIIIVLLVVSQYST
jgi:hypothetical protein